MEENFNTIKKGKGDTMRQETINFNAETILRKCNASTMHCAMPVTWKQWNKKNCYVSSCINNRYFLVKSYSTIVAVIDDQQGELYELGKWTPTTSKQVTQLFNMSDRESYSTFGFQKLEKRYLVK